MPDLVAAAHAIAALADTAITDFAQIPTMANAFSNDPRFAALFQALSGATLDEKNAALDILAAAINSADPYQGNRIALVCGSLVEDGCDASRVAPALLQRLPGQLALVSRVLPNLDNIEPAALFPQEPDGIKAWEGLRFLLLATMTVFCRDMPSRILARSNPAIVDPLPDLAEHRAEAYFLSQLLSYTDGMEVTVLHVAERKGWRVRLEAIKSHPHFHTLLQARLISDSAQGLLTGEPVDPEVVAVARNEARPTGQQSDHARFECYFASALQPDGSLYGMWITSESTPEEFYSLVDGERVMLIGPLLFGHRGWDTGFFANIHDALRPDVTVLETLTKVQVQRWLDRLHQSN